ncbi:hypothetical protein JCM1840_001751 [Sporobolomyces johnsonii]
MRGTGLPEAAARLEGFDTNTGDAPKLWKDLTKWYGETDAGVEKISALHKVMNLKWEESESPALHFARTDTLWSQLNTAYKADAELMTNTSDPDVFSDRARAISTNLQRDIFLTNIPQTYRDALLPSVKCHTTYDEVRTLLTNLWTTKAAHEEIAVLEARRVAIPENASRSTTPDVAMRTGEQGRGDQGRAGGQGLRDSRSRAARPRKARHSVSKYEGWRSWPDGTFTDAAGTVRLKIKPGRTRRVWHARASAVDELKKNGVVVPIEDANALVVFDLNPGVTYDSTIIDALLSTTPVHTTYHVDTVAPLPTPSPATPADIILPESTLRTITAYRAADASPQRYILDGGATRHFTTSLDHLASYVAFDKPLDISGAFESFGNNVLRLPHVVYAPSLGVNLVSQTRMMMAGYRFTNNEKTLNLWYPGGSKLITSFAVAPTISIEASHVVRPSLPPTLALSAKADDVLVWHARLGHPSDDRLRKALAAKGMGWEGTVSATCEWCIRAKATRKGVEQRSDAPATRTLERLAADVWGPSPARGKRGERFTLGIVDSASRYAWVEPMANKLGVAQRVIERIKVEERATGCRVVSVQTDNGTEFLNTTLDSFLKSQGVQHRLTVPYVHNQNGLVERRWRQWLETTRALLLASGLSLDFWGYALSIAVYLYNRTPSIALGGISPYESYHGVPPSLDHLRPWGCFAWLALPRKGSYRTTKLEARAVAARFVGYPPDRKGWLFWVPEWRSVVAWWEVHRWEETRMGSAGSPAVAQDDVDGLEDAPELFGSGGGALQQGERPLPGEDHLEGEQQAADAAEEGDEVPDTVADTVGQPDAQSPTPAPSPSPEPPAPPAPAPAPRRSGRLAGDEPSHFSSPSSLALATLDVDLDHDDSALAVATFDGSVPLTRAAIEHALSTSPAWTGSLDQPSFQQAMAGPDADKWLAACEAELGAFDATGTWEPDLVDLPAGRKSIAVKWVLLVKRDSEGQVIKYKARLVARGDMQVDGVDFDETHSSTVRLTTVRLVFALLATHTHWGWAQFDISNAYLLGNLSNEIYIHQPPGFIDPAQPKAVRRLRKALYGLRQGGRKWQKVLRGALEGMGFRRVESDHGLYVRRREGKVLIIPTHVDDGTIVGDDDIDGALADLN